MAKIDWLKLKTEYKKGGISLRDLAEKHSVSYSTLSKRAWKENWEDKRNQIGIKVESKTDEKIIAKAVDRNIRFLNISDMALDAIEEYLKDKKYMKHIIKYKNYVDGKVENEELVAELLDVPDTKAFSNMIASLDKIQKGQRLGEGLDEEKSEDKTIIINTNIPRGVPDED